MSLDLQRGPVGALLQARSAIVFPEGELASATARVHEFMAAERIANETELLGRVRSSSSDYEALLGAVFGAPATFFRVPAVFDAFQRRVLPEMHMKKFWDKPRSLRLWSAGCGAGEEAYSLALLVAEAVELSSEWNVHLLAGDVRARAIEHAQRGAYYASALTGVRPQHLDNYFARIGADLFVVKPKLRNLVNFARMNLADLDYTGRFDCIFCVDVLPYIAPERAAGVLRRFYEALEPGGYLFLGGSVPADVPAHFERIKDAHTVLLQKPAATTLRTPQLAEVGA